MQSTVQPIDNNAIEEQIRLIRRQISLSMNGICAEKIRQSGMCYTMTFGTDWIRLKEIAAQFPPNCIVADRLWHTTTRETKLIATLLCPTADFDAQRLADWMSDLLCAECAEIVSLALLSKCPHLHEETKKLLTSDSQLCRTVAYHTIARTFTQYAPASQIEILNSLKACDSDSASCRRAIESLLFVALRQQSAEMTDAVRSFVDALDRQNSLYQSVMYEMQYL